MTHRYLGASLLALCCATAHAQPASPVRSIPPANVTETQAPPTVATPRTVTSVTPVRAMHARRATRPPSAAVRRVIDANRAASREPLRGSFINGAQVFPFEAGAVYEAYTAPGEVTDITLQAGETLNAVASGDTARWIIGDTTSGSGESRRTHILVKPALPGLVTNLVITTDRRSYHVRLTSTANTAMSALSWSYPQDELLALQRRAEASEAATPVAAGMAIDSLNFGYAISGDRPPWRPVRAFDDGRQTFIEFPADIATGDAPPLFVIGTSGAELVNYRMRGRYYVVDRLFEIAELRLGTRDQQVVRIEKQADRRDRRRRRAS
jgi:type IV secretion system protein TrbG